MAHLNWGHYNKFKVGWIQYFWTKCYNLSDRRVINDSIHSFFPGSSGVVQGLHSHVEFTHLFVSVHQVYPLLNPLWSYLLQIRYSKRLFLDEITGLKTICKFFFHVWMDLEIRISSLKMPDYVVVSAYSLTAGQYWSQTLHLCCGLC